MLKSFYWHQCFLIPNRKKKNSKDLILTCLNLPPLDPIWCRGWKSRGLTSRCLVPAVQWKLWISVWRRKCSSSLYTAASWDRTSVLRSVHWAVIFHLTILSDAYQRYKGALSCLRQHHHCGSLHTDPTPDIMYWMIQCVVGKSFACALVYNNIGHKR